jgi:protoporphyrinogen oxidase
MTILIAKQNQAYISKITGIPKERFKESTKNTVTFSYPEEEFQKLYNRVKDLGENPYALMTW